MTHDIKSGGCCGFSTAATFSRFHSATSESLSGGSFKSFPDLESFRRKKSWEGGRGMWSHSPTTWSSGWWRPSAPFWWVESGLIVAKSKLCLRSDHAVRDRDRGPHDQQPHHDRLRDGDLRRDTLPLPARHENNLLLARLLGPIVICNVTKALLFRN